MARKSSGEGSRRRDPQREARNGGFERTPHTTRAHRERKPIIFMVPLNPKLFDKDVNGAPIRKGFGEGLLAAGELDHNIVALCADLTESTMMHLFKNKFPNRFIEMGIMEQSMASIASGMAAMGKIPFFSSYAMFSPGRNW